MERDGDWVRFEIRRALERGVPIVPVLLDGTALPARLPGDVRRVVHHQAATIRHECLGADARHWWRLAEDLYRALGSTEADQVAADLTGP